MLRSRVSTTLDVGRVAAAVSRPGIDPRVWCSYAVLTSEPFIEQRAGQQDVFVSVQLLPTGTEETARVGAIYAGNGFGLYAPLHKDDEVLVIAPSGDPDEGLVVTQRLWSPADPPPSAITAHPEDVTLVVESGRSVRIGVAGGGRVYLGDGEATRGVARIDDTTLNGTLTLTGSLLPPPAPPGTTLATLTYTAPNGATSVVGTFTFVGAVVPGSAPIAGRINSASDIVRSA